MTGIAGVSSHTLWTRSHSALPEIFAFAKESGWLSLPAASVLSCGCPLQLLPQFVQQGTLQPVQLYQAFEILHRLGPSGVGLGLCTGAC